MTETQKRIEAYKAALPGLKERVLAVALLLVVSISMLTSASFAWLTISRRPEVTAVSTNVAANGNLEIALATSNEEPAESKVGDSSAAKDQSVTAANITWGNLINLSDDSYGLENLTLQPAQLNTAALLTSPLYGAVYTSDGRVERLTSNFSYTSWIPPEGNLPGYFGITNNLGVRAISSTKIEAQGFTADYLELKDAASSANARAAGQYTEITQNAEWMNSLANMVGIHMTANLNSEDKYINREVSSEDLNSLIAMYGAFIEAFETEAQAMANLLNLELYLVYGGDTTKYSTYDMNAVLSATKFSGNDFIAATVDGKTVKISNLKTFISDYDMLKSQKIKMEEIDASGDRRWTASGLKVLINKLVDINDCLLKFNGEQEQTVSQFMNKFSSNPVSALNYMNKECTVTLTNGVFYNFDQRIGAGIKITKTDNRNGKIGLPITATMYVNTMNLGEQNATVYATLITAATTPSEFQQDLAYADTLNTGAGADVGQATAQDTYALAIDLWVRTNAENSYLTLEGNVLTEENQVPDTGRDSNGREVELYTLTRTWEEDVQIENDDGTTTTEKQTVTMTYDLYKTTEDGTVKWYDANAYSEFALDEGENPTPKMKTIITVIGYEGENRIWAEDGNLLSTDATTQGSGSCYVYYADSPEDQARSLELLKSMKVAFVDGETGRQLAVAEMDTSMYYAESGRVIVPLVLSNGGNISEGNTVQAITMLEKNVPKRITAIVYLDGNTLSNENVLAAADIQGQLNIQFGSSLELKPIEDEDLSVQERKIYASVTEKEFDFDTATGPMTTKVIVNIDGEQPKNSVTAFFMRKINATQGSREEVMTFTKNAEGAWEADYTFTAPGSYVLRTVYIDGQEYLIASDPLPEVKVNGFTITHLSCTQATDNKINIMTADSSSKVDLTLKFASSDEAKMPKTVQGRFLREDGTAVSINFTYNSTLSQWEGSATFLTSGDYTLQYLVLDGEYSELPAEFWQTATVYLGMRVAVYTTSPNEFKYSPSEMEDKEKLLSMQVKIMDNTGEEMFGLTGAKLTYSLSTSTLETMDTDLKWNPVSEQYEGYLRAEESGGPGIWVFRKVSVGGNDITMATTSTTFTMISPEPPSYAGITNKSEYTFDPTGNAKMEVNIKQSATAAVWAIITDENGNEYEVKGTPLPADSETTTWQFVIPDKKTGKQIGTQNGIWKMKEVRVWNYYDTNGNYITEEDDYMVITEVATDRPAMKVVETFTVSFAPGQSQEFNGAFMENHAISGINVDIYDWEDREINVTSLKLSYNYDGEAKKYGGYTSDVVSPQDGIFTLEFEPDNSGTHFIQKESQSVQFAGNYTPATLTVVAGGRTLIYDDTTTNELPDNVPSFIVRSVTPAVTIAGRTNHTGSSTNDNTVTVVFGHSTETSCGITYHNYSHTSVTLNLSGIGKAGSATLTFTESNGNTVQLYTGKDNNGKTIDRVDSYSWATDGDCLRWVGYLNQVTGNDSITPAGTIKATKLILTHNNVDYEVDIDDITIINTKPE
ncbi:MAG: hypothetical protein IJ306_01250 [Oscillospiraceae bacterium]|nr:hypothetical protein [Oscillospiraceae bacterium]